MIPFLQRRSLQSFSHKRFNQAAAHPLPVFEADERPKIAPQDTPERQPQQFRERQKPFQQFKQEHFQPRQQQQVQQLERDELDLTFNNTRLAFKSKRFSELLRNYVVLGLCSSSQLVRNNEALMRISRRILGKHAFGALMRATFYGQFVAGKDEVEIQPIIEHLSHFGVKALIDYSAEEDVRSEQEVVRDESRNNNELELPPTQDAGSTTGAPASSQLSRQYQLAADFADRRKYSPVARTYFYHGESQCEKNLEIFFRAIESVANTTNNTGLVAIKLTALGRPQLLMKLSKIVDYMHEVDAECEFSSVADLMNKFKSLDPEKFNNALDEDEDEMLCNLMRRVNRIAAYAHEKKVRCMIDAEQTYMQPAINMIALELMRDYNKEEAIVFNTYQCYLKRAFASMQKDVSIAKRDSFFFGAKLVRGAYIEQERQRAHRLKYDDPINENFEATTTMYEQTLSYLMDEIVRDRQNQQAAIALRQQHQQLDDPSIAEPSDSAGHALRADKFERRICIMVASHNEDTVRFAVKLMAANEIKPEHRVICFGQLYGMCDHISFTLGQSGYSVYKYMPYGPLDEVLPYLGRRAIENHGFLNKLRRERRLLARELLNRLATLRCFYKPVGNYKPA